MPTKQKQSEQIENRLLAMLPESDYKRLKTKMEQVSLEQGEVLINSDEPIPHVYFPVGAMISIVSLLEEGASVESGIIGNDGMVGIPIILGAVSTPMQSVVQIPGTAWRVRADVFLREFNRSKSIHDVLLLYMHVLMVEISQTAACNKLHSLEGRLARWLLMSSDSVQSDELPLTHEFLSTMLGVRRAGVTVAANRLREEGLISYRQGSVTITNRKGLEGVACECYNVVKREFKRVGIT